MLVYTTCRRPIVVKHFNFKNQSQCSTPTFTNFKNQSAFYNHYVSQMNTKQLETFFQTYCTIFKNQRIRTCYQNGQKTLTIALAVLDAVTSAFLKKNGFIDSTLKEECEKEKMTGDHVIFYFWTYKKVRLDKYFCFRPDTKVNNFCLWKGAADSRKEKVYRKKR